MNSDDYIEKFKDKILESQVNLWNGIMIFSGIVVTFIASENNRSFLSVFLIILYFLMASLSMYLIFQVRSVYSLIQNRLPNAGDISEEQKRADIEWATRKNKSIKYAEIILKFVSSITIFLTFGYIIKSNVTILKGALKAVLEQIRILYCR